MKEYEVYSSLKVPKNSKIIIRLDGRSFHTLARDLELVKPYDENFYRVISEVCNDLFNEFSPLFAYTFSDEISLLLDNVPFDGRIENRHFMVQSFRFLCGNCRNMLFSPSGGKCRDCKERKPLRNIPFSVDWNSSYSGRADYMQY